MNATLLQVIRDEARRIEEKARRLIPVTGRSSLRLPEIIDDTVIVSENPYRRPDDPHFG